MEQRFFARATVYIDQCVASYMCNFKTDMVTRSELRRWGKYLDKYFDDNGLPVYVECRNNEIDNLPTGPMSPFVAKGDEITLKSWATLDFIYGKIVAEIHGKVLPHLLKAKNEFSPQNLEQ